jgi:AraC-like DNA-binding protein
LKQAAELLSQKKQNITEIAELTGFNNPNNFSTAFKELFGVSPSAYKEYLDTKKENEETQS